MREVGSLYEMCVKKYLPQQSAFGCASLTQYVEVCNSFTPMSCQCARWFHQCEASNGLEIGLPPNLSNCDLYPLPAVPNGNSSGNNCNFLLYKTLFCRENFSVWHIVNKFVSQCLFDCSGKLMWRRKLFNSSDLLVKTVEVVNFLTRTRLMGNFTPIRAEIISAM